MCPVMSELGNLALFTRTVEGSLSLFQTFPLNTKQEIHLSKWTNISTWFVQAQIIRSKRILHVLYSVSFPGSYQISGLHDYYFCLHTLHVPLSPLSSFMEVWHAPLTFANTSAAVMVPTWCLFMQSWTDNQKKKKKFNKQTCKALCPIITFNVTEIISKKVNIMNLYLIKALLKKNTFR